MPQVYIQPVAEDLSPLGPPINLEVASFTESRQAKLVTYSRAQAFLDTSLVIGAYNRAYELTVIVPQDFINQEDIETLLAGLQYQLQLLVDVEGEGDYVRINQISPSHTGGQPYYYSVDISATSIGLPFVTRQVVEAVIGASVEAGRPLVHKLAVSGKIGGKIAATETINQAASGEVGTEASAAVVA